MAGSMRNRGQFTFEEKSFGSVAKLLQRLRRFLGRGANRTGVLRVAAFSILSFSSAVAFEQNPSSQEASVVTVEGIIRDTAGQPLAGVTVLLEEKGNSAILETKTSADGSFVVTSGHAGTFTVRARKAGCSDAIADALALSVGDKRHLDLVLRPAIKVSPGSAPPAAGVAGAMEFKDEPNFTVAGVTDWTNVGLHGSTASSQASESLAKQTLTLKSSEPAVASASDSVKRFGPAMAYRDKGDFAGAREQVRKQLLLSDDAEGHRLLGELDERLNEPLEAVREYEKAARMDPSEQNYFEWGSELLLHKAAQPAAEVFTKGFGAHPNSARMLAGLGVALYSNGSYAEAARRLCEASDLQPSDPAPYLFLGKIEKETPAPLPCSEQKLARFAQERPGNALANYYYAISVWKREKGSENPSGVKQAEALLEKAVAVDPRLDVAFLQLGILHYARGDFERAIADYQRAIKVNPSLGEAHRQLGLVYQRTGDAAKAQQEFQVYDQIQRIEAAELERQRRQLRQFLIVLKDQPAVSPN
jgi:tetratricopeptide (TPR) repeat protein